MKKIILMSALTAIVLAVSACSKSKDQAPETVAETVGTIVGEEIVMPEEGTDTTIIATGTAVMVDTNQK